MTAGYRGIAKVGNTVLMFFKYKPINLGIVFIVTTKANLTLNYVLSTQTILFPIVLFRPRFIQ